MKYLKIDTRLNNSITGYQESTYGDSLQAYEQEVQITDHELSVFPGQTPALYSYNLTESKVEENTQFFTDRVFFSGLYYKIYDYMNGDYTQFELNVCPSTVAYNHLPIDSKTTYDRGLIIKVDFVRYQGYTGHHIGNDFVIVEEYAYDWISGTQIPSKRYVTVKWLMTDDTVGHQLVIPHTFHGTEPLKVHEKRKNQNIINIKGVVFETLRLIFGVTDGTTRAYTLLDELEAVKPISTYIQGDEQPLINAFATLPNTDLDVELMPGLSLRTYVLDQLSIPYH